MSRGGAETLGAGDTPAWWSGPADALGFRVADPTPKMVGRYQLDALIGRGGMGVVYRARQASPRRNVALKMILAGHHAGPQAIDRFVREGDAIARLQHANVVQVYEAGEHEGLPYYSMELVEGGSLNAKLDGGPLESREAAELVRTLALAVDYAHRMGVVHRDLKPANILLTADGTPKISDFGLAKLMDAGPGDASPGALTESGAVLGTPSYMSPEQASGSSDVGAATDVYALGAILYETLTGRPPFTGDNKYRTLELVRSAAPAAPSGVRAGVPRWLEAVCLKCLEKSPAHRYATARDLADDLGRWLNDERPRGLPGQITRVRRAIRRRPRRDRAVVLAGLALIAAGAYVSLINPDRSLERIQAALARRESVTLVGRTGTPKWSHWRVGQAEGKLSVGKDGTLAVTSWTVGLLELTPDTRSDSYRVTAQVRHETADIAGEVGVYFGRKAVAGAPGGVELFTDLSFNGVRGDADFRARLPAELVPRRPRFPVDNSVKLKTRLVSDDTRRSRLDWGLFAAYGPRFKPLGEWNGCWHDLELVVTPGRVTARWDGQPFSATAGEIQGRIASTYAMFPPPAGRVGKGYVPRFETRGGLGLYVLRGFASFRAVTVTPL